jgi:hypothetical protein
MFRVLGPNAKVLEAEVPGAQQLARGSFPGIWRGQAR